MESTVELRAFVSADQKERNEYKTFVSTKAHGDYTLGAKLWAAKKNRPANDVFGDLARQQKFMKMTFNFDKFADQDWDDYWMMAQHCDHDRPFQQKALDIIKQYLGDSHSHYKYLSDRISCGLKGTQKYRTQDGCDKDVKSENIGNVVHEDAENYKGVHKAPDKTSGAAPLHDLTQIYPDDIYSDKASRYYGDMGGDANDKDSARLMQQYRNKPNATVKIYRAVPIDKKDISINAGDWITINKNYAVQHGKSALYGKYKIVSKIVSARTLFTDANSIHEFGYDPTV